MRRTFIRGFGVAAALTAVLGLRATVPATASGRAAGVARLSPALQAAMADAPAGTPVAAWVLFEDKEPAGAGTAALPADLVSARSLRRRAKVLPPEARLDAHDLPVLESDVREVAARVTRVRQRSKWFNGVSVLATPEQIVALQFLPRVRRLDLVRRFRRDPLENPPLPEPDAAAQPRRRAPTTEGLDYGPSLTQVQQMNVPALHAQGITGQGVLIGHFDNGYRLLSHEALASLQVAAAYDFVDHDADPAPPVNSPSNFGAHGIMTLSVIGGYKPGELVGTAYGAQFVLARTEDDASETPLEEDNWIAAIEWADSLGIDVASTSLGYNTFDAPYFSYQWFDMDGDTPFITQAADWAAQRGIVVCNSAGNEGSDVHNTLLAPADGDSVIAVGAVTAAGVRSTFSSVGPTADVPHRIKPDFMAMGALVHVARTTSTVAYGNNSGTSFSCPLAAGAAALLLSARPAATPMQIRDALRATASNAAQPDNLNGWGIIDAVAALNYLTTSDALPPHAGTGRARIESNTPNPFNPATSVSYWLPAAARVTLRVYDARGHLIRTLKQAVESPGHHTAHWNGMDERGRCVAAGVYGCTLAAAPTAAGAVAPVEYDHRKLVLLK